MVEHVYTLAIMFAVKSLGAALVVVALATSAKASLTSYTDLAAWQAATGANYLQEDFEDQAIPHDVGLASFVHSGWTYGPSGAGNVFVASPGYSNFGLPGVTQTSILTENGNEDFLVIPDQARRAVGFDTYTNNGASGHGIPTLQDAKVNVYSANGLLGTSVIKPPVDNIGFFGVVSDSADITSVEWLADGGNLVNSGIDNVRTSAVPEPMTFGILALAALAVRRRRA